MVILMSSYFAIESIECRSAQVPFSHLFLIIQRHNKIKWYLSKVTCAQCFLLKPPFFCSETLNEFIKSTWSLCMMSFLNAMYVRKCKFLTDTLYILKVTRHNYQYVGKRFFVYHTFIALGIRQKSNGFHYFHPSGTLHITLLYCPLDKPMISIDISYGSSSPDCYVINFHP